MGGDGLMWFGYEPWISTGWSATISENAAVWNAMATPYWQHIAAAYHGGENDSLAIANVSRMITGWYEHEFVDYLDGGMVEGFMTDTGEANNRLIGGDWRLSASRILRYLTGNGKIMISQPNNSDTNNLAMREWWVANYFLLKNNTSYYFYARGQEVAWWPEYDIDLGAYTAPPTQNLADLLVTGTTSLYHREYADGLVLVNPGESAQSYTLNKAYCQYAFSGGGTLNGVEKPTMTLTCNAELSGAITIEPHTALILRKNNENPSAQALPAILYLLILQ
ncbi:MAG: hypothetical protein D3924_09075 [Candidatus Electrothrix sp. AR4]|nr:hypothetical protein [Candidatus Electrothrix sp. AR4]